MSSTPTVDRIEVRVYRFPTDTPEGDGTIRWKATTMVLVNADAGGARGLGYTYASRAAGALIVDTLASVVEGRDAFDLPGAFSAMQAALRNVGIPGAGMMALSAVDLALWDLKARLLGLPIAVLLGRARKRVPIYGSGGFTTYDLPTLERQLRGWVDSGIPRVKMKVGSAPDQDPHRVDAARACIGDRAQLMVDANGAYSVPQSLELAESFAERDVKWFEEPVSSEDLVGLAEIRRRVPAGLRVAAGEYGDTAIAIRKMLEARCVDVLQADATRCGGVTGFLRAASMAHAFSTPFSAHCAPALHGNLGCSVEAIEHLEYFHDHVRLESLFFDGVPKRREGWLEPDHASPGFGLQLKDSDAEPFQI